MRSKQSHRNACASSPRPSASSVCRRISCQASGTRKPSPKLRALEEPERLVCPAGREQTLRDLGRDLRRLAGLRIVLGDEAVDVTLCVGDVLERHGDRACTLARPHLVLVGGATRAPAHRRPLVFRRHRHWRATEVLGHRFQGRQPLGAECLGHDADQAVILAIAVVLQRIENSAGESLRVRPDLRGELTEIGTCLVEDANDGAAGVVAALEDGRGECHESPHERQRLIGIGRRNLLDDGAPLGFEIRDQRLAVLPGDETAGAGDACQPLGDLPRGVPRALGARQRQPQLALGGRVTGADLDQQLRQALCAQRFEVLRIEGRLGSHRIASSFPRA